MGPKCSFFVNVISNLLDVILKYVYIAGRSELYLVLTS